MDKDRIKSKVIAAYRRAKTHPEFLSQFQHEIQAVIDSEVPETVTHSAHVYHDIQHLSAVSKKEGYSAANYLRLIANYVVMIVKAVEEGKKNIDVSGQADFFEDNEDFRPTN